MNITINAILTSFALRGDMSYFLLKQISITSRINVKDIAQRIANVLEREAKEIFTI